MTTRTLYALVAFTGSDGTAYEAGAAIDFEDDKECFGLLHYGIVSGTPPRRQPGESSARVEPVQ